MKRPFIAIVVLALLGLSGCGGSPPSPLSPADVTAITILLRRETSMPVRSLRPERGGVAVAFLSDGKLGGQEFKLIQRDGQWRVVEQTCFF